MLDGDGVGKKGCLILLKILSPEVCNTQIWRILEKLLKTFSIRKNLTSCFKIGGIFRKELFRKFFDTSVIISFLEDNSLYFGKLFKKLF